MRKTYVLLAVILMTCVTAVILALQHSDAGGQRMFSPGYEDTPMLPGTKWHVHDPKRPQARVVAPGTCSTQDKPGRPPSDAIILFDGKDLSKWQTVKGEPAPWKMEKGYLEVVPKSGDIYTREKFGNIQLHVEWTRARYAARTDAPVGKQRRLPLWRLRSAGMGQLSHPIYLF